MPASKKTAQHKCQTPAKRTKRPNGGARAILDDLGADEIIERIYRGESLNRICASVGVNRATMHEWIHLDHERLIQVEAARACSAEALDDAALAVLEAATDEFSLRKARELANHYRWQAMNRDPRRYGGKVRVKATVAVEDMDEDAVNAELAAFCALAERDEAEAEGL